MPVGPRHDSTENRSLPPRLGGPAPHVPDAPPQRLRLLCRLSAPCLACALAAPALAQQPRLLAADLPEAPQPQTAAAPQPQPAQASPTPHPGAQAAASLTGLVVDRDGAMVQGARITLTRTPAFGSTETSGQTRLTAADGTFSFPDIPAGPYQITVAATGFVTETTSGTLTPGEHDPLSPITLHPGVESDVEVSYTTEQIAEDQIHAQEKQRVFGALPNYYVSYVHNPAPLSPRQKFELSWKTTLDPVNFAITGLIAGIQQANNTYPGYGQGAAGYGKRYGAGYADLITGTFLGGAILPVVFKQDPRYFYQGTGSVRSRFVNAIAFSVLAKGDNGHWQPNYSGILGSLAAAGISNAYYPASDRNGAGLTFRNTAIGIGGSAVANLFQEFLVRKLTPKTTPVTDPVTTPAAPAVSLPAAPAPPRP